MPKPVCVKCRRFMRPKTNGIAWVEGMPHPCDALPGLREPENWKPYKLWISDLWQCPDCRFELISGHSHDPLSEYYMPEFANEVRRRGATIQINDC